MQILKNILGRVFALWTIIVFIVTMIIVYIPFLLSSLYPEPKRTIHFISISRFWMKLFFLLNGVRRIIRGKENFKPGENYIVVCNHNTFMDVPVSSVAIPGKGNKTIAKAEMARIPVFGLMYKQGSVLVNRKSEESRKLSYLKMREVLAMGLHMCIYPEGTRNRTSEPLQKFHDGAFKLAIDSGHSIMPAVIFYSRIVFPTDKKFYFWPHRMEMHFLPPVSPKGMTVELLKNDVFEKMKEHFIRHNSIK